MLITLNKFLQENSANKLNKRKDVVHPFQYTLIPSLLCINKSGELMEKLIRFFWGRNRENW